MIAVNPNFDWQRFGGQALSDVGTGIAQGGFKRGFGIASEETARLAPYRQQEILREAALVEAKKRVAGAAESLKGYGFGDLADAVSSQSIDPEAAWAEAFRRMEPGYGTLDPTPDMRNFQFAQDNPGFADFINPAKPAAAPSGYQATPDGLAPIPGGPADPNNPLNSSTSKPPTEAQVRASSLATQIQPDVKLLLGDGTKENPGVFDALGNGGDQFWNGINVFGAKPATGFISSDYKEASNAATNIAQTYLYVTSGAAAPAEEVKKITDLITPAPFDSDEVKTQKKQRLQQYVTAIQAAATREMFQPTGEAGTTLKYNPATGELE